MSPPTIPPPVPPVPTAARRLNALWPGGWVVLGLIVLLGVLLFLFDRPGRIGYSDFQFLLERGQVKKLTIVGTDRAVGEVRDKANEWVKQAKVSGDKFTVNVPDPNNSYKFLDAVESLDKSYRAGVPTAERLVITREEDPLPYLGPILWTAFLLSAFAAFFILVIAPRMRDPTGGGFITNYIRSPARRYEKGRTKIAFEDVAGMEAAKRELQEVVEFLQRRESVHPPRRPGAEGRAPRRPAGHGQDAPRQGRRRRGERAVLQHQRLRIHSDVRGRRGEPGPGPVQDGERECPLRDLH